MTTTIALIDDESAHAAYYQLALESKGYAVEHFKSPASLLTRLRKGAAPTFSLFVTDLMMPPRGAYSNSETNDGLLTGLPLARDIRAAEPETPIVIFTNLNIEGTLGQVKAVVEELPNLFLIRKSEYPPDELADAAHALLSEEGTFQEQTGMIRRFLNSLILQPNFCGFGIDLKRWIGR